MQLEHATREQLTELEQTLSSEYNQVKSQGLSLDLTRGKPSPEQLSLSNDLDGILQGNYLLDNGTDIRNYGGIDGIPAAKALAAEILQVDPSQVLIGGNSSLTLMYQNLLFAHLFGVSGEQPWQQQDGVKFLCPSPGYDRHFAICEELGIEMITVAMTDHGPDMDQVESLLRDDSSIKGIWCVPHYSNPTGISYSDDVVDRIAALGKIAAADFRVMWDNAYAVHHLGDAEPLRAIRSACQPHGTEDQVLEFGSTSKVTFAGAGIAFMAASPGNLSSFKKHLGFSSIGPDKVNQLRHVRFLKDLAGVKAHMLKHAELLQPRFACVIEYLQNELSGLASWTEPKGGYFVSVDTAPGLAQQIGQLAADAGVKLTPAGATFPYGKDPQDNNIRLAPSFPSLDELDKAMQVFTLCVKLASVRQKLG